MKLVPNPGYKPKQTKQQRAIHASIRQREKTPFADRDLLLGHAPFLMGGPGSPLSDPRTSGSTRGSRGR